MTMVTAETPAPLVTREALAAFTQRLVGRFAPEQVILFGSQVRGEARWDSDADILVVMPFEGRSRDTVLAMRETCKPDFPLDLHLRLPEEIAPRYRWGDPYIREALDHGEMLHGEAAAISLMVPTVPVRNPVVEEWYPFRGRDAPVQDCAPDDSSLSDQATVSRVTEFRDPAAGMASPRRGDGQSRPAPGTARHPFLVV